MEVLERDAANSFVSALHHLIVASLSQHTSSRDYVPDFLAVGDEANLDSSVWVSVAELRQSNLVRKPNWILGTEGGRA